MRILILGGDGMLGHQLLKQLESGHKVQVTLRKSVDEYQSYGLFSSENTFDRIDVNELERLASAFDAFRPEVVINAIGIIKQRDDAHAAIGCIKINALFPHLLAELCKGYSARLIHMSTDCVFSGAQGGYTETDFPDAGDLYGRTKLLGEVSAENCITLRTSIIGLELARKKSLVEWFLAQQGKIKGFSRAIFSGLTTIEMARLIDRIIKEHSDLSGVYQVAAQPISKFELLSQLKRLLGRQDLSIEKDDSFVCDRSLKADKLYQATGYRPPSWGEMLNELVQQIQLREQDRTE